MKPKILPTKFPKVVDMNAKPCGTKNDRAASVVVVCIKVTPAEGVRSAKLFKPSSVVITLLPRTHITLTVRIYNLLQI